MTSNGKLGILFALALLLEVVGAVLLAGPFGSALSNIAWDNWFIRWAVVCGAMLLIPWISRWWGGPKPWRLFSRGTPYQIPHSLYLGLLLGIVIAAFKALLSLILRLNGVPFDAFLPEWALLTGETAFLPLIALSLAGAYFVFGYIQGILARVFGERIGMIAAAILFALGSTWPFGEPAAGIADVPSWVILLTVYLPIGIALAYLGARTKSVFSVLAAVLTTSWLAGLGAAVHSALGWLITILVMIVMLLVGIEVLIGERCRAGRFIAGFFRDFFTGSVSGLPDGVFFVVAATGLLFAARLSDMFYEEWYISVTIPAGLVLISFALWVVYSIISRKTVTGTDERSE